MVLFYFVKIAIEETHLSTKFSSFGNLATKYRQLTRMLLSATQKLACNIETVTLQ